MADIVPYNFMKHINWPSWPNYTKKDIVAVTKVVKSNQIFAAKEVKKFEVQKQANCC